MIRFDSDYTEGAHPDILNKLQATNLLQTPGYSEDSFCASARAHIRRHCADDQADVHFVVGGTQANLIVSAAALRAHQGIIAADSGHISTHESGAIEAAGHKVLTVPSSNGKITAADIKRIYEDHWNDPTHEHSVQPAMVYVSQSTESGTIYKRGELEEISRICKDLNLLLYLDGARLGYALAASDNDLSLDRIAGLCDVFYIGGTKVGALFGEAVVITNEYLKKDFRYIIKQRGGLLAKGRLLGIQFETLFADGLYFKISEHAVNMSMQLRQAFAEKGYSFLFESSTNQQFPIISDQLADRLAKRFAFHRWQKTDSEHTAIRLCTSWATSTEAINELIKEL